MKARTLKIELCEPSVFICVLRTIAGFVCIIAPFLAIPFLFSIPLLTNMDTSGMESGLFSLIHMVIMLIFAAPFIYGVCLLTKVFTGTGSAKELRANGRMSCEFLERNGLLQAAAEEFYGKDRYVCKLGRKGWRLHRYSHRKNVLTPNFIFIMSDNIVLTYEEVKKARFLRTQMKQKGKDFYADTFSLQMADGTEIALFSSLIGSLFSSGKREMIRRQGIVTEIANRIHAKNPDCEISRIDEVTRVVSFDSFKPFFR